MLPKGTQKEKGGKKTEINYSNVMKQWANQWPEVTRWLGKLQRKRKSAFYLYRFCQWAGLNPRELLALKKDPSSKEAERLLDTFVSESIEGMTNPVKVNVVTATKSFYKHNYSDLARASGVIYLEKKKPYHKPTKEELRKLREWCLNPRDRSIISLAASTAIAKETIVNLKWGHLEDDWEKQDIPHISLPSELIKGHGRGKYKGVRQETFLTPEAKQDLLTYKAWIEKKMGRKLTKDDHVYVEIYEPYKPLSYSRLGVLIWQLSKKTGISFSLHDCRRFVETALEEARIPPNWARKIRGRKVRGEEAPYSRPAIDQLRQFYREAVPKLQFITQPSISEEEYRLKAGLDQLRFSGKFTEEQLKQWEREWLGKPVQVALKEISLEAQAIERIMVREGITIEQLEREAVMIPREAIEQEIEKMRQERSQRIAEIMMQQRNKEKTKPNGNAPYTGNCQKIVSEDELEAFLAEGWQVKAVLPSGKIVISTS